MKKYTNFIRKIKGSIDKTYIKYTFIFLGLMLIVYFYLIFASMASTPAFTYAEF